MQHLSISSDFTLMTLSLAHQLNMMSQCSSCTDISQVTLSSAFLSLVNCKVVFIAQQASHRCDSQESFVIRIYLLHVATEVKTMLHYLSACCQFEGHWDEMTA